MDKKRTDYLHIRTTPETVARIESLAEKLSISKTAVVQMAINEYLKKYEAEGK